jgi:hypothetical protein
MARKTSQAQINPQQRSVEPRRPPVAIGARLECEKPVDRSKLKTAVGNQDQIADGIDHEPRSQDLAGPEMQKDRDQRDLLG